MANEPDGDADNFESIEVVETPERDNPKFGAVTVHFETSSGMHSLRMTTEDAETLLLKLHEYLYEESSK